MTGTEDRTVGREHDAADVHRGSGLERIDQLRHRGEGEGVAFRRIVDRDRGEGVGPFDRDVLVSHC